MKNVIHNLPFKFRIFFGCLTVALIPLVFSGIFMVRIFDASLGRQSHAQLTDQLNKVKNDLDQLFLSCEQACKELAADETIYRVMIDNTRMEFQKELYSSLYRIIQETYSYTDFSLYDIGGMLRFTTNNNRALPKLPVYWGLLHKASRQNSIVYYRTDPYLTTNPSIVFQAACPLENSQGVRSGYIVLDFTKDSFYRLLGTGQQSSDLLILTDALNEPFYCSLPAYGETEITRILKEAEEGEKPPGVLFASAGNPHYGYSVLLKKSPQISSPAMRTMNTISFLMALFGLMLCLFISFLLSHGMSRPISILDSAMSKVRDGDLSIRIVSNRKDELGRLSDSFNHMTKHLEQHLFDAIRQQKALDETHLTLYQTQLNPHFLYNTLDAIKWSAKISAPLNGNSEIPVLAENLAYILRSSISSDPLIPFSKELETLRCYVEIQKIRFTEKFLYEEEIPEQLENCLVPKMILQPLVENAILHGLSGCDHGYLCIYARTTRLSTAAEALCISVTDDGAGISQEMMEWIHTPNPQKRPGHLGLYNVIQILKLYYGKEYGLHAKKNPEGGTTVSISLPVQLSVPENVSLPEESSLCIE